MYGQKRGCPSAITVSLFLLFLVSQLAAAKAIQQISIEDGLLGGTVWGIESDNNGFIWVATSAGLYRYDGYDVRGFEPPHPLSNAYLSSIIKHPDGSLWVATMERGIWRITSDNTAAELIIPYEEKAPYQYLSPNVMYWVNERTLLLGLSEHVLVYDLKNQSLEVAFTLPTESIEGHLIRSFIKYQDKILIGTSAGMFAMDLVLKKSFKIIHTENDSYTDSENIKLFFKDSNFLWFASVAGVYRYPIDFLAHHNGFQDYRQKAQLIYPDLNVWDIWKEAHGHYLVTNDGLMLKQKNHEIEPVIRLSESPYYISSDKMTRIHKDPSGYVWLGSMADGLFVWNPKTTGFNNISELEGMADNVVWSIVEDPNENVIWVGTEGGLTRVDMNSYAVKNFLNEKSTDFTDNIVEDLVAHPNGLIYTFTSKGIRVFNPDSGTFSYPKYQVNSEHDINAYAWGAEIDNEANIWWFTEEGVFKYNPEKAELNKVDWLTEISNLAWDCDTFKGPAGRLFFSCPDNLLLMDESKQSVTAVTKYQEISRVNEVYSLAADSFVEDHQGHWWLTLGAHGIVILDPNDYQVIKQFIPGQNLPNSEYYSLTNDPANQAIWVASGIGLFQIKQDSYAINQYTVHEGTFTNDFVYADGKQLRSQQLVYGSGRGLIHFKGSNFTDNQAPELTTYLAGSRSLSSTTGAEKVLGSELNFSHTDTGLTFYFTTLNFKKNKNVFFRFELGGAQDLSFPPQRDNSITFPQLKPGNYTLTTTATHELDGVSGSPLITRFSIAYAWWQTPTAKAIYLLLLGSMLYLWLRYRKKHYMALAQAHKTALKSERKLSLALQSSNSHVWEWHALDNQIEQSRINDVLGYIGQPYKTGLENHISLIHPEDQPLFVKTWQRFINLKDSQFRMIYRMRDQQGHWVWFSDIATGQIEGGRISKVTGTFTNITDQYAQEHNAALYGEIFQQAYDAVIILTNDWRVETANKAFLDKFERDIGDIAGLEITALFEKLGGSMALSKVQKAMVKKHYYRTETALQVKAVKTPMLVSCSEVKGMSDEQKFLLTLTSIKALKEAEQALVKLAKYDQLTGLPNRTLLMEQLHQSCDPDNDKHKPLAMMFVDLDKFKQVNDSLGHARGDELLLKVGERISRKIDETDLLARFGGDEFVVLIDLEDRNEQQLDSLANEIISSISRPVDLGLTTVAVSPSIGIAKYPADANSAENLLQAADVAMYHAKAKGRGTFEFYSAKMKTQAQNKLKLDYMIKQDHDKGRFINYYQPIIGVKSNRVVSLEILLRWKKDQNILLPGKFIKESEDIGLLGAMTLKALRQGLDDLKPWLAHNPDLSINLNISAKHFEDPGFVEDIKTTMAQSAISAKHVNIELTESTLLENKAAAMETIKQLRALGHRLFLDDFGTGYSSLSYIHELSMDGVKVDKSFVKSLGKDERNWAITQGIIQMCSGLGFTVVAEGVETVIQHQELSRLGASHQQGFLFAEPVAAEAVMALLEGEKNLIPQG
ncbi:EAL domain-containing protein [Marinicella sp. S1101]|uniref:EAL domain-containing protein n=1 Tax=Marinicella marina TaxID=2996016 RepID=UPI0022609099|nr:EAL domain-containing protein [Marinicella marina]MCX7553188.1 EAL domain-containing protein [Marinicella marina]MDJ1138920.1 EAL domain-containing protein [Marinicella marina]